MNIGLSKMIKDLLAVHGQIPQGLEELGIQGRRDSDKRYEMYGLDIILEDHFDVLDIGCNCGFLSCLIAKKVRRMTGIDIDATLIKIANLTATALNIRNCVFFEQDLKEYKPKKTFDLVMASQIHMWVKWPFDSYIDKIKSLVSDKGYLLFESHDTDNVDADIDTKIAMLCKKGFSIIHSGHWVEDPGQYWLPPKKHKKIPRQYYLMRYRGEA